MGRHGRYAYEGQHMRVRALSKSRMNSYTYCIRCTSCNEASFECCRRHPVNATSAPYACVTNPRRRSHSAATTTLPPQSPHELTTS